MARDNFSEETKKILARRVNYICANPDCRRPTSGPHTEDDKSINVGEASHICAADSGGKRYDPNMTREDRISPKNGIWLCRKCGKLIDSDEARYTVELLHAWKKEAEHRALRDIEGDTGSFENSEIHNHDNILIKYSSIGDKNKVLLTIIDKRSYESWQRKSDLEKEYFLYDRFCPNQFLILGADLYRGTIRYKIDNENFILLGMIEMTHNASFKESTIHLFNDYSHICNKEENEKDFTGHIGV